MYDCLRCPKNMLWMLADTIGYKYDDRLPSAFNRLVLMYFMSMIRNRGSRDGITLAAEVNLAQLRILADGAQKDIMYDRLEDTSIPVNAVYVTPHTDKGYIDVTYFSTKVPIDACIEYVRPVGMYVFQNAGVRYDARTKLSVDAKLTDLANLGMSIGPTHVGHYRRDDYARMQRIEDDGSNTDTRHPVYYRNSKYEQSPDVYINPGYRALYSLQLCNNEQIMKSLGIEPIFSIGYGPQSSTDRYTDDYIQYPQQDHYQDGRVVRGKPYNLRYDYAAEQAAGPDVYTVDLSDNPAKLNPVKLKPAVNPIMHSVGDAISLNSDNTEYTEVKTDGSIDVVTTTD